MSTTIALEQSKLSSLIVKLDSFSRFEPGWSGYSAAAPSALAIENAKALIKDAQADDILPDRVEPSATGGVGVTFSMTNREVVVEFYNNGTAHALFADNANEELATRPVSPSTADYRGFLDEVRKFRASLARINDD
jgi:hypothetical protein